MKKTIKIGAVVAGLFVGAVQLASAQGYVDVNTYDASLGAFLGNSSTAAPVSGGTVTFFELMGGASAGSLSGVVSDTTHTAINALTDLNGNGAGSGTFVDVGNGPVAGVAGGGTGFFQAIIWAQPNGAANFGSATFFWESAVWSQAVGNPGTVTPPGPPTPTALAIALGNPVHGSVATVPGGSGAVMTAVPEPSIYALDGLGAAELMANRSRK